MSTPEALGSLGGSIRTCVGCRQRTDKLELMRVVAQDRGHGLEAVPDLSRRAPGRGAHLHPTPVCLDLALRRRALPRALRTEGSRLDTTALEALVRRPIQHDHGSTTGSSTARPNRNWSSSS